METEVLREISRKVNSVEMNRFPLGEFLGLPRFAQSRKTYLCNLEFPVKEGWHDDRIAAPIFPCELSTRGVMRRVGRFQRGYPLSNQFLEFIKSRIRDQDAVTVRVSSDQQRNFLFRGSRVEKNGFFRRSSKQITSLEAQTKRGTRNFREEEITLCEPVHIARKNLLRRNAPIRFPGILLDQMLGEHVVSHGLKHSEDFRGRFHRGAIPSHGETKIDFHTVIQHLSCPGRGIIHIREAEVLPERPSTREPERDQR